MSFSILRIFYIVKDDEKMRQFLAAVLDTVPPVLDSFDKFLDEYSIYRIGKRLTHKDTFEMAGLGYVMEKLAVGDEGEMVIFDDNEDEEMEEIEEEETPGAATMGERWVIIAQR